MYGANIQACYLLKDLIKANLQPLLWCLCPHSCIFDKLSGEVSDLKLSKNVHFQYKTSLLIQLVYLLALSTLSSVSKLYSEEIWVHEKLFFELVIVIVKDKKIQCKTYKINEDFFKALHVEVTWHSFFHKNNLKRTRTWNLTMI